MKKKIIIELGSNYDSERNIKLAKEKLANFFPEIRFSRLLRTAPIGMESGDFMNALAYFEGHLSEEVQDVNDVLLLLKNIERECGRVPEDKARNIVRLDLDLLQFGDSLLKEEDWKRNYVQCLFEEIRK